MLLKQKRDKRFKGVPKAIFRSSSAAAQSRDGMRKGERSRVLGAPFLDRRGAPPEKPSDIALNAAIEMLDADSGAAR